MQQAMPETPGKTRDTWVVVAAIGVIFLVGGLGSALASLWLRESTRIVYLDFLTAFLWLTWSVKVYWSALGFFSGGLILGAYVKVVSPSRVLFWVVAYAVAMSFLLTCRSSALFTPVEQPVWPITLAQIPLGGAVGMLAGLLGAHAGRKLRSRAKEREEGGRRNSGAEADEGA